MLIFGQRHLRRVLAEYSAHYNTGGRIERCSCVHRARDRLPPSPSTARSGDDRSSAGSSTSIRRRPETDRSDTVAGFWNLTAGRLREALDTL